MSDLRSIPFTGDRVSDMVLLLEAIIEDVPVADSLPGDYVAERDGPCMVVEGDGTPEASPLHSVQTVRVLMHAQTRPMAHQLMDIVDGILLTLSLLGIGIAIRPGQRLITVLDDESPDRHFISSAGYSVEAATRKVHLP